MYQATPAPTPAATPKPLSAPPPENYGELMARTRAVRLGEGTPEEKKEATALGNALASADYGADNPDRWHSPNQVENPVRYQLRAGFVIPAVLLSGVNSEVPGTIIGQVAQNVFDNATGTELLIPQGARLIGSYAVFRPVRSIAALCGLAADRLSRWPRAGYRCGAGHGFSGVRRL